MLASDPRPNRAPHPVDCADSDPATWRMRAGVPLNGPAPKPPATQAFLDGPPEGAETGLFGWFRKAEQRTQVAPRVQMYAFDPMFMTQPDLYFFERDGQPLPRKFYKQTRRNKQKESGVRYDRLGNLTDTANGDKPISIYTIEWEKKSGNNLDFEMYDREMRLVVEGYCKTTDYGGAYKWVAVITQLHGADLPLDQGARLFSYPLYEALATGVSFGVWYEDKKIQEKFPNLGQGRPRDDERELNEALERNTRLRARRRAGIPTPAKLNAAVEDLEPGIAGLEVASAASVGAPASEEPFVVPPPSRSSVGAVLGRVVRPPDVNRSANTDTVFDRYTPEGGVTGAGMVARPSKRIVALGAIYPIRDTDVDIRTDGLCITRMNVEATPVKFGDDPGLKGIARYTVRLYADAQREPVGTLAVTPAAVPTSADEQRRNGGRTLRVPAYIARVAAGSRWTVPGKEEITVTADDVETVYHEPVWDARLMESVEAAIYQLATRDATMTVGA